MIAHIRSILRLFDLKPQINVGQGARVAVALPKRDTTPDKAVV